MEEERRRRLSLVKDEEAKEAHEKEIRRQNRLIAVLEEEEARARAFYKFEFDNNLRERRDMKEAEQAMRLFMLESKSQGGSKSEWKSNFGRPTPSTRCCLLDGVAIPRHRRDLVPVAASARWRGGSRRSTQYFSG